MFDAVEHVAYLTEGLTKSILLLDQLLKFFYLTQMIKIEGTPGPE